MKEKERLKSLMDQQAFSPYSAAYDISGANFNFLLRKAQDHEALKKENQKLKEINYDLESLLDQIRTVLEEDTF